MDTAIEIRTFAFLIASNRSMRPFSEPSLKGFCRLPAMPRSMWRCHRESKSTGSPTSR